MTRPALHARFGVILALLGIVLVVVLVMRSGSDDGYKVMVDLENAGGLRDGTPVKIGGVPVGGIDKLDIYGSKDQVRATLKLDDGKKIGPDAKVEVVTSNLLGSKFIELKPGDLDRPEPSGAEIPASRVTLPTDLDEVLNVLDADTRTRLQILVNELGTALTGRKADFNRVLAVLPNTLGRSEEALDALIADNRTLATLVKDASGFIAETNRQSDGLVRFVDVSGAALETTANRRSELRSTLARAPATLRSAQRFLVELEETTKPLEPAARLLARAAPELTDTLAELPGFQRAATPVLRKASQVSPSLTRLTSRGTPVIKRAVPTAQSLATFSESLVPVSRVVDTSFGDVIAIIEGWARAIQNRDGISHIFHGRATLTPDVVLSLVNRLTPAAKTKDTQAAPAKKPVKPLLQLPQKPGGDSPSIKVPAIKVPETKIPKVDEALNDVIKTVDDVLGALTGSSGGSKQSGSPSVLDSLLRP